MQQRGRLLSRSSRGYNGDSLPSPTEVDMIRHSFAALLLIASVATPAAAQQFKVAKYSIGGDGGTDYLTAEPGTGRVFVSRSTHVMVIDGATGKVIGDIPDTPRNHGIALAPKSNHGFITSAGDSTVTMFDLKTLAPIKKIKIPTGGLDGIMYEDFSDRIILTNHSRPIGTAVALDAKTGDIVGTAELEDDSPEGAASDGKGKIFVNNEGKSTIQVIEVGTMKVLTSWPLAPCEGPTGIAYDRATNRIFSGCGKTSVVVDPGTGKVVATIANGEGVDALGWDPGEKLIYIPARRENDFGRSGQARRLSVPAGIRPVAARNSSARAGTAAAARAGDRGMVFRD